MDFGVADPFRLRAPLDGFAGCFLLLFGVFPARGVLLLRRRGVDAALEGEKATLRAPLDGAAGGILRPRPCGVDAPLDGNEAKLRAALDGATGGILRPRGVIFLADLVAAANFFGEDSALRL